MTMRAYYDENGEFTFTVKALDNSLNLPGDYLEVSLGMSLRGYKAIGGHLTWVGITITDDMINAERDRRVRMAFSFNGYHFDNDPASKLRITGAGSLAGFAIANGAQPNDLRWHGGSEDFRWIDKVNGIHTMDAQTVFAMAQAASEYETGVIFSARTLKDMDPRPIDYDANSWWPYSVDTGTSA